jgi:hypothetical protein
MFFFSKRAHNLSAAACFLRLGDKICKINLQNKIFCGLIFKNQELYWNMNFLKFFFGV